MRQLWLDNEVLDENGVRNYMSNAKHTQEGARLRNVTVPKGSAQQDVDVMGSFQVSSKLKCCYPSSENGKKVHNLRRMHRHWQAILSSNLFWYCSNSSTASQ